MAEQQPLLTEDVRPGNYELYELTLSNALGETINIVNLCESFNISESLNSFFCVYEFTIVDAVNLLEKYSITGNEKLTMTILKRDSAKAEKVMITKHLMLAGITDYAKPSNEGQAYKIKAISELAFASALLRVNRSDNGTVVAMVQRLLKDINLYDKVRLLTPEDVGNYSVVYPSYSYKDTIAMLLTRAQTEKGTPYYLFETLFNDIIITTYDEMVSRSPLDTYILAGQDRGDLGTEENFEFNRKRIRDIDSQLGVSHFDGMKMGAYNAAVHSIDIATKTYKKEDHFLHDQKLPKLDKDYILHKDLQIAGRPIAEFAEPIEYTVNVNSKAFEKGENLNNRFTYSVAKRASVTENQYAVSHKLTLAGDTRIRAGEVIELDLPPALHLDLQPDDRQDVLMSGKYVVSAVMHQFDMKGSYILEAIVRKDSIDFNAMKDKYKYLEG